MGKANKVLPSQRCDPSEVQSGEMMDGSKTIDLLWSGGY